MQFLGFKVTQVTRYGSLNFRGHSESKTTKYLLSKQWLLEFD